MFLEKREHGTLGIIKRPVRYRRLALRFNQPHQRNGGRRGYVPECLSQFSHYQTLPSYLLVKFLLPSTYPRRKTTGHYGGLADSYGVARKNCQAFSPQEGGELNPKRLKGDPDAMREAAAMAARWQNMAEYNEYMAMAEDAEKGILPQWIHDENKRLKEKQESDDFMKRPVEERAETGDVYSMRKLCEKLLKKGEHYKGTVNNWLDLAVEKGGGKDRYEAAILYYENENYEKALYWFIKTEEEAGLNDYYCNVVGEMYENGLGIGQDSLAAAMWYEKAVERGDYEGTAKRGLARLRRKP
jgi:hypothetical protein